MTARTRNQRGTGVVEMIFAMTLSSLVLGAMVSVAIQQERFYRVANDAANAVSLVQRVQAVVSSELLPLNPAAGDVAYADPDSLVLRGFRGVYSVCDKQVTSDVLLTVTRLTGPALEADSIFVYSHGPLTTVADNHWKPVAVTSVLPSVCPDGTVGWTATVPGLNGLAGEVPIGAPVRAFRRARYWVSSEGGSWFVKTDALDGSAMVVSGPLAPADSALGSVARLRYLDGQGDPLTALEDDFDDGSDPLDQIARVEVDVAAVGRMPIRRGGAPLRKERTVAVKLRNAGQ